MDPVIEELCRASELQPHVLRRMQDYFRGPIQQKLDERESLIEENAALTEELARLKGKKGRVA